ncbi:serine phosphatase RsbU (regulator of sigma subunit) [Streptomyces sp. KhCrAH-43]|uniref:PP2C family protein-serine/threonine phosphatase n=1 Tax=unclassified Streptomyces TaxID=2593676 RepID=UPI00037CB3F6|nr:MULTISPECIES: fused response regulator/phosphatase [unclassified Streptomyces]MYS33705.1 SpoIIE family protein phosphatase [Streptomyces sp. SID4920]MYX67428.1 SpoIIE family protein phosphatase [Streptomyces sp. SID8373]RAJ48523.1 serine phosphatase RsbU (regulator of sigma subunit) [Streptomyces sp. KhCrAH-43]
MTAAGEHVPDALSDPPHYRILLIEDDLGDALLVEELLNDTGLPFELTTRTTLAQARTELASSQADCILLDLHLPDVSGIDAVTAVRTLAPHTAVIVLTGLAEAQAGTEAMAAGAQDYLVKGKVEPDLLHRTVRYAVYRSRTERASSQAQAARQRAEENARLERGLLPQPILDTSTVRVTSRYLPGAALALLGGDFLDVVEGDGGLLHAVVGDVSGHGPDAAALGVFLRIAWRSLVLGGHQGEELLHLMERILIAERGSHSLFATCTLLRLDHRAGTITLHLAGHHEPLLTTADGTREVTAAHGVALGIVPGLRSWPSTTIALPAVGALTLYTDGLTEGHSGADNNRLGVEGLLALIENLPPADPAAHVDRLIQETHRLNAGRHSDDLAVLRLDWGDMPSCP